VDVILRAAIVFGTVLLLAPQQMGKAGDAAPASGVIAAVQSAVLDDIARVRSDIAESQAARGGSLLDRI
jgi:hypothetical protein